MKVKITLYQFYLSNCQLLRMDAVVEELKLGILVDCRWEALVQPPGDLFVDL